MIWREDQKYSVFKNAMTMVKTSHNIIGEQCIRSDEKDKKVWKSYEKHLNTICMELEWLVSRIYSQQCTSLDSQGYDEKVNQ